VIATITPIAPTVGGYACKLGILWSLDSSIGAPFAQTTASFSL
jgi:hypothetical protein